MSERRCITVITPVFNEEDNVRACYDEVKAVFDGPLAEYDREHLFCDNRSTDGTIDILRELAGADPCVKGILNARNFGPLPSTFNALLAARGDAVVVLLAADLQDPPAVVVDFVKAWEAGNQIAYGVRRTREEGLMMRVVRGVYYRLVHKLSYIEVPINVGSFQLIDRVVVEALRGFEDHFPHVPNMIASCGFKAVPVPYDWKRRRAGTAKNKIHHLVDEALNSLISFTKVPMRLCMFFGFAIAALSILYALVSVVLTFVNSGKIIPAGIQTLIVGMFFFSGVQLFFLGVLGEYIAAIHSQVRKRPLVIEEERVGF